MSFTPPPSKFSLGQQVSVILGERNRTAHHGTIREIIWHFKDECHNYYLEAGGKKISKRYFESDLQPVPAGWSASHGKRDASAMKYFCNTCHCQHDGFPSWGADRPTPYWDVPLEKRESDVFLTSDSCVIAGRFFFIRCCLAVPIVGTDEVYSWGVWASLSEPNFFLWQDHYGIPERSHIGPFFGWLCSSLSVYPETLHLKSHVHLRNGGLRPLVELEATDHPLSIHQREGITIDELSGMMHRLEKENPS